MVDTNPKWILDFCSVSSLNCASVKYTPDLKMSREKNRMQISQSFMYTPLILRIKWITNENLLHSTGDAAHCPCRSRWEGSPSRRGHIHMLWLIHCVGQAQRCKATRPQQKVLKNKICSNQNKNKKCSHFYGYLINVANAVMYWVKHSTVLKLISPFSPLSNSVSRRLWTTQGAHVCGWAAALFWRGPFCSRRACAGQAAAVLHHTCAHCPWHLLLSRRNLIKYENTSTRRGLLFLRKTWKWRVAKISYY